MQGGRGICNRVVIYPQPGGKDCPYAACAQACGAFSRGLLSRSAAKRETQSTVGCTHMQPVMGQRDS